MEWNLDQFIATEIQEQGVPVQVVANPKDADFVMTSFYQGLGSRLIAPGHYIQVKISAAGSNEPVWFAESGDYAVFFGRLRPHGPARAAKAVVRKLGRRMSPGPHRLPAATPAP